MLEVIEEHFEGLDNDQHPASGHCVALSSNLLQVEPSGAFEVHSPPRIIIYFFLFWLETPRRGLIFLRVEIELYTNDFQGVVTFVAS